MVCYPPHACSQDMKRATPIATGMPSSLEKLDLSNCTIEDFPVDLGSCLPRLQVLRLSAATYRRTDRTADEPIMFVQPRSFPITHRADRQNRSLPHGLKALIMPRLEITFESVMLLHFPSSIVHLDISHGSLAELVRKYV